MTDKKDEIQAMIGKLAAELIAVQITDHFARAFLEEERWLDEYSKKHTDETHTTNLAELPEVRKVFRAYSGFLEAASSSLTQLLDHYGGELVKCKEGEGSRYTMSSLYDIMSTIKAQMDEEQAKTDDEEELDKRRATFLDYYAGLIQDTAKDSIPLPKHIQEAMKGDKITLISVAGRPADGIMASGAHNAKHGRRKLTFDNCTFWLDYNVPLGVWWIHADGIPDEHIRKIGVKLHGLNTEAIVAYAKDLGEVKEEHEPDRV